MTQRYSFITVWKFDAPIECVWDALHDVEAWPRWWKYVQSVRKVREGGVNSIGQVNHFTWSSALPYKLSFNMRLTRLEKPYCMEGVASGELNGIGRWDLSEQNGVTTARYTWMVSTNKLLLNLFAPIARLLFMWNHDIVMKAGGEGLARLLGARLLEGGEKGKPSKATVAARRAARGKIDHAYQTDRPR
jgi:Polyketide cyclase / dehydrase and lipid transport